MQRSTHVSSMVTCGHRRHASPARREPAILGIKKGRLGSLPQRVHFVPRRQAHFAGPRCRQHQEPERCGRRPPRWGFVPYGRVRPRPLLVRVIADDAYDTVAVYETATERGATGIVPTAKTANISGHGPQSPARDRTITVVKQLGRRCWKMVTGYHRQGRVENTCFRYKSIIGDGLRARSAAGQGSDAVLGCEILNRVTAGCRRLPGTRRRFQCRSRRNPIGCRLGEGNQDAVFQRVIL